MGAAEVDFHVSILGIRMRIGPADESEWRRRASLIRADYEACHPDETFADLLYRARFSKEDKGLLRNWMVVAARRAAAKPVEEGAFARPRVAA